MDHLKIAEQREISLRRSENDIQNRKEFADLIAEHEARWKGIEDDLMAECERKKLHNFIKGKFTRGFYCNNCGKYKEALDE